MARHYAGVDQLAVAAADFEMLWEQLRQQLPQFAQQALTPHGLMPGFLICFEGGPFLADFDRPLRDGDHLLILSLDVGG
ncbi:MAG: hypothetical protein KatS3mg114_1431 [Planctomycetaceae bacterium]|nr:MAG: hypothetical protein KatS3mg114_1431 [Planctomycetaceae bacterium]